MHALAPRRADARFRPKGGAPDGTGDGQDEHRAGTNGDCRSHEAGALLPPPLAGDDAAALGGGAAVKSGRYAARVAALGQQRPRSLEPGAWLHLVRRSDQADATKCLLAASEPGP
jgi:hypothetical protein